MRDLLHNPLWRPDDLGTPIPESPHAVSACLPTWRDNIGYEEQEPRVVERLTTGYPRFVYNRFCRELFDRAAARFAGNDETAMVFSSYTAAARCREYLQQHTGTACGVHSLAFADLHAVTLPRRHAGVAKDYWQHTGDGVSSRWAEACLTDRTAPDATAHVQQLRGQIARLCDVGAGDVYLFSSGMAALFAVHRALLEIRPERKSVQFGFPYVDTLKIQQKFGSGAHFFPQGHAEELGRLEQLLASAEISALYTEFPSNPLLRAPDVERLEALANRYEFPLVIDDTVASFYNARLLPACDVVWSSLTKFFSGVGDVTAGSVVLNPAGRFYDRLSAWFERNADTSLYAGDAAVLVHNAREFEVRVAEINISASRLAEFLHEHPRVRRVHYPSLDTRAEYDAFRTAHGGYGGLLSLELEQPAENAPRFYDALRVTKGPNLGTNYTLACPFTILAHYHELDWAGSCGVSRHLIRVSVGREKPEDLIARFESALAEL